MLSAQMTVWARHAVAPDTDWFNPSIAHQHYRSSELCFWSSGWNAKTIPRQSIRSRAPKRSAAPS